VVYRDHGVSGAKGPDKRPVFDKLCRDATVTGRLGGRAMWSNACGDEGPMDAARSPHWQPPHKPLSRSG